MTSTPNNQDEFALQRIFSQAIPPVVDDGFSTGVVVRIRRNIWKRRLVLAVSVVMGLAVGLPAIAQALLSFSNSLAEFAVAAQTTDALGQFGILLSMLPLREGAEVISQDIAQFSAQIGSVSWYEQNRVYVLAGVMTAVSFVATRVLVR
ncbi:MAG: hypothetical protein HKN70_04220 [Gammaproteobacteria bacterium]|nr:hypothetical protein [Gammaproteobacteria bacterium]